MRPLDEVGQKLAVSALASADGIAARYARLFPEHAADIESSAAWGAVRAASTYEPVLGGVWERWSNLCVESEVKNCIYNSYHRRRSAWPQDDLEAIRDDRDSLGDAESSEELEALLGLLPTMQRSICELVYKDGLSPYSAGQALGITGDSGGRLHRKAIDFLRRKLSA